MLSSEVHTIQHTSQFLSYLHPYAFTYDNDNHSVHFWTCTQGAAPTYIGTLQGQILEPLEIRLISPERVLIRAHSDKNNIDLNSLLIYQLPGGNLLDTLTLGDVSSFEVGAKGLLGVADEKIAVWRHAGPQDGDVIDLYSVNEDGKFGHPKTLKAGSSLSRIFSVRINGHLSDELVYIESDQVLGVSSNSKVPCSMYLTRWSAEPDQGTRKIYDFNDPPSLSEGEDWWTRLGSHVYIRSLDALVIASLSSPLGFTSLDDPSTILQSVNTKTTNVNWKTSLLQETEKLIYLPSYDAILAIGDSFPHPSSTSVIILDPHSGAVRQEHILPAPEKGCGKISTHKTGVAVDLALSQKALIVIFGDGQSASIPMERFMKEGFKPFINDEGRLRTAPCPETSFGVAQNSKQRKRVEKSDWRWISRAVIGDEQVVLVSEDRKGFVVVPLLSSPVV